MKNKFIPGHCYGTPEEIQELFKQGLTGKLAVDKLVAMNGKVAIVTPCVAPHYDKEKKRCVFLDDNGDCSVYKSGTRLYICQNHKFRSRIDLAKQWMKMKGEVALRFLMEMSKVD